MLPTSVPGLLCVSSAAKPSPFSSSLLCCSSQLFMILLANFLSVLSSKECETHKQQRCQRRWQLSRADNPVRPFSPQAVSRLCLHTPGWMVPHQTRPKRAGKERTLIVQEREQSWQSHTQTVPLEKQPITQVPALTWVYSTVCCFKPCGLSSWRYLSIHSKPAGGCLGSVDPLAQCLSLFTPLLPWDKGFPHLLFSRCSLSAPHNCFP